MKKLKYLAAVALLCAGCAVSYYLGYNAQDGKNYEAACILNDICRYQLEYHDEDGEFDELYYDYLSNLDCYDWKVTADEVLNNYNIR